MTSLFEDCTPFLDRSDILCQRLATENYLFFRNLLKKEQIQALRTQILQILASSGWLQDDTDPLEARPGSAIHHSPGRKGDQVAFDEGWYQVYVKIQQLEGFHELAHDQRITEIIRALLADEVLVHPRKIARISFPGAEFPTPPHQDAEFNRGTPDILTIWIPLGNIPQELGGLRVLRGSASMGRLQIQSASGVSGKGVNVDPDVGDWVTTEYEIGDALIFHGLAVHMAPANIGDQIRLSVDYRYQSINDQIKPGALLPHGYSGGHVPSWGALSETWRSHQWIEVPYPVKIVSSSRAEVWESRLIPTVASKKQNE